jgi:hypothetical protein
MISNQNRITKNIKSVICILILLFLSNPLLGENSDLSRLKQLSQQLNQAVMTGNEKTAQKIEKQIKDLSLKIDQNRWKGQSSKNYDLNDPCAIAKQQKEYIHAQTGKPVVNIQCYPVALTLNWHVTHQYNYKAPGYTPDVLQARLVEKLYGALNINYNPNQPENRKKPNSRLTHFDIIAHRPYWRDFAVLLKKVNASFYIKTDSGQYKKIHSNDPKEFIVSSTYNGHHSTFAAGWTDSIYNLLESAIGASSAEVCWAGENRYF